MKEVVIMMGSVHHGRIAHWLKLHHAMDTVLKVGGSIMLRFWVSSGRPVPLFNIARAYCR